MRRFQIYEQRRTGTAGSVQVHARLRALRDTGWSVVGVFQLTEQEWQVLSALCAQLGIVVIHVEESAIAS